MTISRLRRRSALLALRTLILLRPAFFLERALSSPALAEPSSAEDALLALERADRRRSGLPGALLLLGGFLHAALSIPFLPFSYTLFRLIPVLSSVVPRPDFFDFRMLRLSLLLSSPARLSSCGGRPSRFLGGHRLSPSGAAVLPLSPLLYPFGLYKIQSERRAHLISALRSFIAEPRAVHDSEVSVCLSAFMPVRRRKGLLSSFHLDMPRSAPPTRRAVYARDALSDGGVLSRTNYAFLFESRCMKSTPEQNLRVLLFLLYLSRCDGKSGGMFSLSALFAASRFSLDLARRLVARLTPELLVELSSFLRLSTNGELAYLLIEPVTGKDLSSDAYRLAAALSALDAGRILAVVVASERPFHLIFPEALDSLSDAELRAISETTFEFDRAIMPSVLLREYLSKRVDYSSFERISSTAQSVLMNRVAAHSCERRVRRI